MRSPGQHHPRKGAKTYPAPPRICNTRYHPRKGAKTTTGELIFHINVSHPRKGAKTIAQAKETEACNNIKYVCLTDDNVNLNTQANPRFTIEKIGRRNKVYSGSEFEMYTTDESTMQCTEYML